MVAILAACSLPLTAHGLFFYLSICPYVPALTCCGIAGVVERGEFPLATGPNQFAQGASTIFGSFFLFFGVSLSFSLSLSHSFVQHKEIGENCFCAYFSWACLLPLLPMSINPPGSTDEVSAKWQASRYQLGPPAPAGPTCAAPPPP